MILTSLGKGLYDVFEEHGGLGAKFFYNSINERYYPLKIGFCQDYKQLITACCLGGSTHFHYFQCTYCDCPIGQFAVPAPYRCIWCLKLDEDLRTARATDASKRSIHQNKLLEACPDTESRPCHHHDFLDSNARKYWEALAQEIDFEDTINVIFPNESGNSQGVAAWRLLGERLGINESTEAAKLNTVAGRRAVRTTKLNAHQWSQAIKDWKKEHEIGYKNIDDNDITPARVDKVCTRSMFKVFPRAIFDSILLLVFFTALYDI